MIQIWTPPGLSREQTQQMLRAFGIVCKRCDWDETGRARLTLTKGPPPDRAAVLIARDILRTWLNEDLGGKNANTDSGFSSDAISALSAQR